MDSNNAAENNQASSPSGASWVAGTEYALLSSIAELEAWLQKPQATGYCAIIEVDDAGVALSSRAGEAAFFPFIESDSQSADAQDDLFASAPSQETSQQRRRDCWALLRSLFDDPAIAIIGHDIKGVNRQLFADESAVIPAPYDDVMVMSYVLDGGKHRHQLADLALLHLDHEIAEKDPENPVQMAAYANVAIQLHGYFTIRLFAENQQTLYHRMEKPLIGVLSQMEIDGMQVDPEYLQQLSAQFTVQLQQLEIDIYQLAGEEFTIGSPKQLGEILFEKLGIEGAKKNKKSGQYKTDASTLEALSAAGHEIADHLLQWRMLSKLISTYSDALVKKIDPKTTRIHSSFFDDGNRDRTLKLTQPQLAEYSYSYARRKAYS